VFDVLVVAQPAKQVSISAAATYPGRRYEGIVKSQRRKIGNSGKALRAGPEQKK
jgi:hypothetical protein